MASHRWLKVQKKLRESEAFLFAGLMHLRSKQESPNIPKFKLGKVALKDLYWHTVGRELRELYTIIEEVENETNRSKVKEIRDATV